MSKVRVAILRGGPSHAYDDSLKTGAYLLSLLYEMPDEYEPLDVFISKGGEWHYQGLADEPHKILSRADIAWNAMHGPYGEDGQVQRLLENLKLPFVGPGALSALFAHNKELAKELYRRHSLSTPAWQMLNENNFDEVQLIPVFRNFMHPVIVKPATGVRALGVRLAHTFQELVEAVKNTFQYSPKVLVEEYISGSVSSCVVIEQAKGERLYTLVPSGRRSVEENKIIADMAKTAHETLGQRHYSSSDFVITPRGKIYILETNSLPVLHENSLVHHSLRATGWRPRDFAHHCLNMALNKEPYI